VLKQLLFTGTVCSTRCLDVYVSKTAMVVSDGNSIGEQSSTSSQPATVARKRLLLYNEK